MAIIKSVRGFSPKMGGQCFLAENAVVVGDVTMGNNCTVWFNAVVRGDVNTITIGNNTNVQDGAVIHCTYEKSKTVIGRTGIHLCGNARKESERHQCRHDSCHRPYGQKLPHVCGVV